VIAPGQLDRRLVLEAPVETSDGAGGVTRSYQSVATLWAAVTPHVAHGSVAAGSAGATATHRIVIRAGRDVTTRHRLRDGVRIFRIVAVSERAGRAPRFIEIRAEAWID
jgi:SPP1 family predicted phage head-tail adaptor